MKNYRKEILEYFIKSYENSAYGNGLSSSPRRITFDLNKKYPNYGGSRFYELTEEIEKVAFQLYEERLVEFSNKSIYGKRKLEFVNNETNFCLHVLQTNGFLCIDDIIGENLEDLQRFINIFNRCPLRKKWRRIKTLDF